MTPSTKNQEPRTAEAIMKLSPKTLHILEEFKRRISTKHAVVEMRLFGSTARGDLRCGSDIDVLVCIPEVNRIIEEELFDIAYDLELELDCLIDLIVVSTEDIEGQFGATPIFETILSEGIVV